MGVTPPNNEGQDVDVCYCALDCLYTKLNEKMHSRARKTSFASLTGGRGS